MEQEQTDIARFIFPTLFTITQCFKFMENLDLYAYACMDIIN